MPDAPIETDALIVGGGVTGLWLRTLLKEYGRSVILIESDTLGAGQTIVSQGILHNGAKYAAERGSFRELIGAARVLAYAWRQHLSGENIPDLSSTAVVSRESWYWNPCEPLPGCIDEWCDEHYLRNAGRCEPPAFLRTFDEAVRRNNEVVISPASLVANLAGEIRQDVCLVRRGDLDWDLSSPGTVRSATLHHPSREQTLTIKPRYVYLAAGAGNEALLQSVGLTGEPSMQRRPLQMAMIRGELPTLCGHWFDERGPRLTVSTQFDSRGSTIWLLGGRMAERANESPRKFLSQARQEIRTCLRGINLANVEWSTYSAVRAEPLMEAQARPSGPHLTLAGNVLTLWPVKLSLVPGLMIEIRRALDETGKRIPARLPLPEWPRPEIAKPPWEHLTEWIPDGNLARGE